MPLAVGYPILQKDILAAYQKAADDGGKDVNAALEELALDISAAIHAYVSSALVTTTTTGVVTGTAAPVAPPPFTAVVAGASTGAGTGSLS